MAESERRMSNRREGRRDIRAGSREGLKRWKHGQTRLRRACPWHPSSRWDSTAVAVAATVRARRVAERVPIVAAVLDYLVSAWPAPGSLALIKDLRRAGRTGFGGRRWAE